MRRYALVSLVTAVALALVAAAPAGAAPAEKTHVEAIECYGEPDFSRARVWFTGHENSQMHVRGALNHSVQYTYDITDGWELLGTNTIDISFNSSVVWIGDMPLPNFAEIEQWGTFAVESSVGDFVGSFALGRRGTGHAVGVGVGDSAGMLEKVDLLREPQPWFEGLTPPAGCVQFGFLGITVIDPHA